MEEQYQQATEHFGLGAPLSMQQRYPPQQSGYEQTITAYQQQRGQMPFDYYAHEHGNASGVTLSGGHPRPTGYTIPDRRLYATDVGSRDSVYGSGRRRVWSPTS